MRALRYARKFSNMPNVPNAHNVHNVHNTLKKEGVVKTYMTKSELYGDFIALLGEMERRKYNFRKIAIIGGCLCVIASYGAFKDWASDQAADVTSKYLENPKFKKDILIFVEATVEELVKSERVKKDISELLKGSVIQLSESPEIEEKLIALFARIFKSEPIRNSGAELSEEVVRNLLHDPKYECIRDEAKKFVVDELISVVKNDEVQKNVGIASWNAFKVWFGIAPQKIASTTSTTSTANDTTNAQNVAKDGLIMIDKIDQQIESVESEQMINKKQ